MMKPSQTDSIKLAEQGQRLMEKSMEYMKCGNIAESQKCREEANKILDEAIKNIGGADMDKLYGKGRNFGIIYNVFEQNVKNLMKSKSGRKTVNEAIRLIQSDKNLKGQFNTYQSFERRPNSKPEMYIEEALKMLPHSNVKDIVESNSRLINVLRSNEEFNEFVNVDDKLMKCYEAVETLMNTPHNPDNLDVIVEARSTLLEHLSNLPADKLKESKESLEQVYEAIRDREDQPNAAELKLYEEISGSDDKKGLFESYKTKLLEDIEDVMAESKESASDWAEVYGLVKEQRFDKKQPFLSIAKLVEMREKMVPDKNTEE